MPGRSHVPRTRRNSATTRTRPRCRRSARRPQVNSRAASRRRCSRSRWPAAGSMSRSSRWRRPRASGGRRSCSASRRTRSRHRGRSHASLRAASCRAWRSRSTSPQAKWGRCRRSCSTRSTPASAARWPRRWGGMLQALGLRRQVLCVTHLPQVAAHADHHFRVVKTGDGEAGTSELTRARANGARRRAGADACGAARSRRRRAHTRGSCTSGTAESRVRDEFPYRTQARRRLVRKFVSDCFGPRPEIRLLPCFRTAREIRVDPIRLRP